jgi:uncharacterized phage-associated protein
VFTYDKVAQMAAYFAKKQGGTINVMKLVKLMYLADRESVQRYGEPISYDCMLSMNNGPVLSRTLNLINGDDCEGGRTWEKWIGDRAAHNVVLQAEVSRETLDHISDADLDILRAVWERFGPMDQWQLSRWTHANCREWKYPRGSCFEISDSDLLTALGRSPEDAANLAQDIQAERALDQFFARH